MAEDLNGYFSSVFTREDISSLRVTYAKAEDFSNTTNRNSRIN